MSKVIKIKKGLDIPLTGEASARITQDTVTKTFGLVPDDFPGYKWKSAVKEGDTVKAGDPLFYAKEDENLRIVSPAAGSIAEVHRGERRKIEYIKVDATGNETAGLKADASSRDAILMSLKQSGLFAMLRQRPFDMVPFMPQAPRDIFVTAFDSAPLAYSMLDNIDMKMLEKGLTILAKLTDGKVYLSVPYDADVESKAAVVVKFRGPHPSGNVGTQIAAIRPVDKGDVVWTLDAVTAARIGKFFDSNVLDFSTILALTGPEVKDPHLVQTLIGAALKDILKGQLVDDGENKRIISGNVLTGSQVKEDNGFLRYPYRQISVIEEGDTADEFMGWASMSPVKYSVHNTFPTFLKGLGKGFHFDARIRGGHRAMIMNNEYDRVFPMDIYPEYLIKAIMAKDIDRMEKLGIYEVAPEDFALPEFVDTSKLELQKMVREGLDYLRQETI